MVRLTHKQEDQKPLTPNQLMYMPNQPVLVYSGNLLWANDVRVHYVTKSVIAVKKPSGESKELAFDQYTFYKAEIEVEAKVKDTVSHPSHYNMHPSGVECIEIVRHMTYNEGSATAYIWRSGHKGNKIEDLKKAIWHLQDEVELLMRNNSESSTESTTEE